jgi:flavin reductase (DIM6/NTAB) family NADH-FMN oxidoreductase RutF
MSLNPHRLDNGQESPVITTAEHAFDGLAFRRTMGHLATGVTLVTTRTAERIHGMTANAVTSVSLDPPLILICLDRRSRMAQYVGETGRFGVNLLDERQAPISRYFARSWKSPQPPAHRFEEWAGVPFLAGSLGALSCRTTQVVEGGDHLVVIARVAGIRVDNPTGTPLIYYRGTYGALVERVAGPAESPELMAPSHFQVYYREWEPEDEARQGPSSNVSGPFW